MIYQFINFVYKLAFLIFASFIFIFLFQKNIYAESKYINHILVTGQSLASGANGQPVLTTNQPFNNIMLNRAHPFSETKSINSLHFIPLVEFYEESISSSMANYITSQVKNNNYQIEINADGWGGHWYESIKKGTEAFDINLNQVKRSQKLASEVGKSYRVSAIVAIHGEADDMLYREDNCKNYENNLKEWQKDYEESVTEITKQKSRIPLFTDQVSSFSLWSTNPCVSLAQLSASENNPNIILVGPKYFLTYTYGPHLTNYSYRLLGEYYGKVYKQVVVDGKPWKPLSPKNITRDGKIITLKLNVPKPPIVLDTELVAKKENYGFEYYDDRNSTEIESVKLKAPDALEIRLNKIPAGKDQRLRYAYSASMSSDPGATPSGSARGNIRDSDEGNSLYGNKLYNWLVHFDKPIITVNRSESNLIRSILRLFIENFSKKFFGIFSI